MNTQGKKESKCGTISLMNTDAKILNKMFANQIKNHILKKTHTITKLALFHAFKEGLTHEHENRSQKYRNHWPETVVETSSCRFSKRDFRNLRWKKGQWDGLAGKVLASKTDNLNLIPGTHTAEKEKLLLQVMLWPPHSVTPLSQQIYKFNEK